MSANDPRKAAADLKQAFYQIPVFVKDQRWRPQRDLKVSSVQDDMIRILHAVQKETPLVHHLTNNVHPPWSPLPYWVGCQKLFREYNVGNWSISNHV